MPTTDSYGQAGALQYLEDRSRVGILSSVEPAVVPNQNGASSLRTTGIRTVA